MLAPPHSVSAYPTAGLHSPSNPGSARPAGVVAAAARRAAAPAASVAGGASSGDDMTKRAQALVHKLQTIIRRLRKELGASAREQGFALCTLFTLDPASITLRAIRRGKAGDLAMLQRIASKAGDHEAALFTAARVVHTSQVLKSWRPSARRSRRVLLLRISSHWSPYVPIRVVNADP